MHAFFRLLLPILCLAPNITWAADNISITPINGTSHYCANTDDCIFVLYKKQIFGTPNRIANSTSASTNVNGAFATNPEVRIAVKGDYQTAFSNRTVSEHVYTANNPNQPNIVGVAYRLNRTNLRSMHIALKRDPFSLNLQAVQPVDAFQILTRSGQTCETTVVNRQTLGNQSNFSIILVERNSSGRLYCDILRQGESSDALTSDARIRV